MSDERQSTGRFERWIVPATIILFCAAAFYLSTTFKKMPPILKRGIQPSDFPQLLLIATCIKPAHLQINHEVFKLAVGCLRINRGGG